MALYFSSGAFEGSLESMLAACEREGIRGIEFSSGFPYAPGLFEKVRAAAGRPLSLLVHNYFPPPPIPFVLNLASTDDAILEASVDLCGSAIGLCQDIGAPFYSVHSGFAMNLSISDLGHPEAQAALGSEKRFERAMAEQIFRNSIAALSARARTCGLRLLIENNVVTRRQALEGRADSLLMTSPPEIRSFLNDLNDDNVGLLLDVGHAKVAAAAQGFAPGLFFDELESAIGAIHLSDNNGLEDSNQPIAADAWFGPYLRRFASLPAVLEVYRIDPSARRRQLDIAAEFFS